MDVEAAIEARRAVKSFDPEHRMTDAEVARLLELTRLAPTAFNMQNWRFLAVQDPQLRAAIREAAWNQPQMTDASLLLVVCADLQAWDRQPERYWSHAPEKLRTAMVSTLRRVYGEDAVMRRDEAMRSAGMAAMALMLAAREMGYDSCPLTGFDFDAVARLIELPDSHVICMIVTVGKALSEPGPRGGRIPDSEVFFHDRFGKPDTSS
ncbi:MAG TPA: nitroreductase family protein [Gammaproteobacteria bacterium]|nr:nitroreductase family protein [Gammaproteobacteria bacterium]